MQLLQQVLARLRWLSEALSSNAMASNLFVLTDQADEPEKEEKVEDKADETEDWSRNRWCSKLERIRHESDEGIAESR